MTPAAPTPQEGTGAPRVLVVDDEANIVTSLQFLLRRAGYETSVAADGEAALAEVDRFQPDLLLLDVMMPRKTGFEVCQELRASGRTDIQIIMLTAKGRESEVAKGLAVGADAYVTKPFSTRDLMDTVQRLVPLRGGTGAAPGAAP
jgi:DNA-binding response OmpR family regulator